MAQAVDRNAHQPLSTELDEECEPRIIRLRLERLRMEGIARTFAAADKILLDWCARLQGDLRCDYEIIHIDGRVQQGVYVLRPTGVGRPGLQRFLAQLAQCGSPQADAEASEPVQGIVRRRIRLPAYRVDL
jgi:hypothetical protein